MPGIWTFVAVLGAVAGLGHLSLLLTLIRRRKDTEGKLVLLYLGLSLVWGAAVTLADLQAVVPLILSSSADRLIPVFATALVVVQLLLACAFLEFRFLTVAATAGGMWTVALLLATGYSAVVRPLPSLIPQVAHGGWAVLATTLVGLLTTALFRSRLALHRNRALYWLLASVPLVGGQAIGLLPAGPLRVLGWMVHLLGAGALTRAAISYWLPNVKAALRSGFRVLLLVVLTAALLLGVLIGAEYLTDRVPLSHTSLVIVLAVAAALLFLPLFRVLQRAVERLLQRVGFDPSQALRGYSQTIGAILDLDQLASTAARTVAEVLDVRRGALLVLTETEQGHPQFRPVPGMGNVPQEPMEFEFASPILVRLRAKDAPLFQYEVDHHPGLRGVASQEREWLRRLEMEIYLPILSQGELTGLLALGPRGSGEPYESREVEFLITLANQTSVALQNARLFEGLRTLNARIIQLNENLRVAYERLERLDRAKTDFLTIASHELRTPLTQVRGYVDILAELAETETLTAEQVRRIAENIARPTHQLESIINAMLDASQIDVEGLSMHFSATTLASTMRLAIAPWLPALEARNMSLTTRGLEDIPAFHGDPERLRQAFGNLISNAIKFTPDGGQITIEAHNLDRDHFEVKVADTGIGISRADQDLIFEKFYRVGSVGLHSSGDFKFKGAGPGLGLPITRGVIEGHGGCIWVVSEDYDEEQCPGSTFHVVLPYKAHRGPCRWRRPDGG